MFMKWIMVKHASPSVQKYHLVEGSANKAVLKYNMLQQSVRVSNDTTQRVFFLERTGFWNNKTIFKNEYGLEIGKMSFEKGFHAGTIEVDSAKYHYVIQDAPAQTLVIYDDLSTPILTCDLSGAGYKPDQDLSSLLLGLCWYLDPTPAEQNSGELSTIRTAV
jgi:hypothetical protein